MKNILGENKNLKIYNSKKELAYQYKKYNKNIAYEYTFNSYGDFLTYNIRCVDKFKHLEYGSEFTRDKKGELINYKNSRKW